MHLSLSQSSPPDHRKSLAWWDGTSAIADSHVSHGILSSGLLPMVLHSDCSSDVPRPLIGPLAALRDAGATGVKLRAHSRSAVIEFDGEELAVSAHDGGSAEDLAQRLRDIAAELVKVPVAGRVKWALDWSERESERRLQSWASKAGVTLLSPDLTVLGEDAQPHWRQLLTRLASSGLDACACSGYVVAICQSDFEKAPSFIFKQPANESWRMDLDLETAHDVELDPSMDDWHELERRLFSSAEVGQVLLRYMRLVKSIEPDFENFLKSVRFVMVPVRPESFQRTFDALPSRIRLLPAPGQQRQVVEETYLQFGWLSGRSDAVRIPGDGIFYRRTSFGSRTECWRVDANFKEGGNAHTSLLRFGRAHGAWPKGHSHSKQGERFPFYDPGVRNAYSQYSLCSEAAERTLSENQAGALVASLRVHGSAPGGGNFESLIAVASTCIDESHMTDIAPYMGTGHISNQDLDGSSVRRLGFPAYMVYGAEVNFDPPNY